MLEIQTMLLSSKSVQFLLNLFIEWPLPREILPASYFNDDLDSEMNDDELLNTTMELEKQYMDQQTATAG